MKGGNEATIRSGVTQFAEGKQKARTSYYVRLTANA